LEWCNNHFNIASYFYYDQHLEDLDSYILNLPIFAGQPQLISWQQQYGMDFNTWNRCHYLKGDIGSLALDHTNKFLQIPASLMTIKDMEFIEGYHAVADKSWPKIQSIDDYKKLPQHIQQEVERNFNLTVPNSESDSKITMLQQSIDNFLPSEHTDFLNHYSEPYQRTNIAISKMVDQKIMITPPPIKKQTLAEKKYIVKNFAQCLSVYNQWIEMNPSIGNPVDLDVLDSVAQLERRRWKPDIISRSQSLTDLLSDQRPTEQ
jgi:hypothetical protein